MEHLLVVFFGFFFSFSFPFPFLSVLPILFVFMTRCCSKCNKKINQSFVVYAILYFFHYTTYNIMYYLSYNSKFSVVVIASVGEISPWNVLSLTSMCFM